MRPASRHSLGLFVDRVIDGDTVELTLDGQVRPTRVQLLGVETPILGSALSPEPWAIEAAWALRSMVEGEVLRVRWAGDGEPDRYGRRFAMLYREPEGTLVNLELVRAGLARVPEHHAFEEEPVFVRYAQRAEALERGIWGERALVREPDPVPPAQGAAPGAEPEAFMPEPPAGGFTDPGKPADASTTSNELLYISRSGSKYHRATCRYVTENSQQISLADARAKYEPCKVCSPPE